jgi:hypothetical protein
MKEIGHTDFAVWMTKCAKDRMHKDKIQLEQIRVYNYQYNGTNVVHFSSSLFRIKGLYMFRALLAHPQEALHKRHLVCILFAYVSWLWHGCCFTATVPQPTDIIRTQYTKCLLCSTSWWWASNGRNIQRPLILNKLNEKCITLISLYWYTMVHGQQNTKFIYIRVHSLP